MTASVRHPPARRPPLLLVFGSDRSGRCRRTDGFLAQVLQRRGNHETFRLRRIEAERHPELIARFRIAEFPTLLVVAEGRVCMRLTKPRGCAAIAEALGPWLK